ncbi:pyridoxamine 5'-phosphate oxidase family protein [Pedobacter sp. SD-b]|uniref:Pyridoxamine 5'-phosphate oxidase family protein n=1 Tax=Pedobacter segetis TaxID=2793069 RepID=A0ABS1BFY6_9SPHI|nr:pyridoxamine 5'-phosphate oxidase family protein [Pedobacter segetis]MBK0381767.1 pyridoxamine 5'-phosphate oxidase family protein [Pedobacter segetis]
MKNQEHLKKLKDLLKGSRICMMSTYNKGKGIHTRPMAYQEMEDDGTIYFFTNEYSSKIDEISENNEINISFSNTDKNNYVVLKADASLSKDRVKMEELFNPMIKVWFPEGLEDPKLSLIKADIKSAEYWDSTSSKMVFLFNAAKSLITGEPYDEGEHGNLEL